MSYERKTVDRYDIEGYYETGWEVECSEYTWQEAKVTLHEYRVNCLGTPFRIVKRRERKFT